MNQYPAWKYLLILSICLLGIVYALPNLYGNVPALQISAVRGAVLDQAVESRIEKTLKERGIEVAQVDHGAGHLVLRFADTDSQLKAQDALRDLLGVDYVVAMNLLPAAPAWLMELGAQPMFLGLDLRGGVHFLMKVDMVAALRQAQERYVSDLRSLLRKEKVRYRSISRRADGRIEIRFRNAAAREKARTVVRREYPTLELTDADVSPPTILARLNDKEVRDVERLALRIDALRAAPRGEAAC